MSTLDWTKLNLEEAIAYFQAKLINVPTYRWDDIWQEEHDIAFMVAGAMSAELLQDLRQIVEAAIAEGMTRQEFRKQFDQIVARTGWAYNGSRNWRTDVIYGTNLRTAYAAGRYQQQTDPDVIRSRPFWMWMHGDSRLPRPLHKALHRKVFRFDDPFWQTMYPPCGFGCKCRVVTLSERDVKRRNLNVDSAPAIGTTILVTDPETQRQTAVKVEADPGFAYVPGQSRKDQQQKAIGDVLNRLSPGFKTAVQQDLSNRGISWSYGFKR